MATNIVMPEAGESVSSGVIAGWRKPDGAWVEMDEPVVDVETDKITVEVLAPAAGVLKHSAAEGDEISVGAVVGSIDESAAKPSGSKASSPNPANEKVAAASQDAKSKPASSTAPAAAPTPSSKQSASNGAVSQPSQAKHATSLGAGASHATAHAATPIAAKIAAERSVDLSRVVGTGASGRIREQDVLAYIQSHNEDQAQTGHSSPTGIGPSRAISREKMSPMRQRIASRLVEAQQTAAMLTTFNECDMTQVMALRKRYKESFSEKHGIGLGFMSFFVKATVQALRAFPKVNSSIVQDEAGKPAIQSHDYCDIAIAVSSPKGLVVPVLRNAETLSFAGVEQAIKDFAIRAKDGKLSLEEMTDGTFTITNGGIFGSLMSTPILNPPQSAILGMHSIKSRPVEHPDKPGEIALRPMMYLALSYDHRIVDGSEAVQFLVRIKDGIENPERLMLDL